MQAPFDSLENRVVVITGASSGIGRAAGHAFARRGARLVLAARRADALREAVAECRRLGAEAIDVPTDVTDAAAVEALGRTALDRFGRIDIWINNAGVGLFGPFTAAPIDAHRRVVEVNLFGAMHGAATVLPIFKRQAEGIMITNISIGGFAPTPFAAAYTASKFALRGLIASLREEFGNHRRIQLCALYPAVVDTPGFIHGANVSGRSLQPPRRPLLPPQKVAEAMVALALRPQPELSVGWATRSARAGYALAPRLTERLAGAVFRRVAGRGEPAPRTTGNLFVPVREGTGTSGGWRRPATPPAVGWAAAGLAAAGAALLIARSRSRRA